MGNEIMMRVCGLFWFRLLPCGACRRGLLLSLQRRVITDAKGQQTASVKGKTGFCQEAYRLRRDHPPHAALLLSKSSPQPTPWGGLSVSEFSRLPCRPLLRVGCSAWPFLPTPLCKQEELRKHDVARRLILSVDVRGREGD